MHKLHTFFNHTATVDFARHAERVFNVSVNSDIADIVKDFEEHISSETKNFDTPAAPSTILMKFDGEAIDESGYRKFVRRILYAVTKVLPDCCNAMLGLI